MKDHFFAGSFGGDVTKLGDDARLECGICWHVYDPAEGCEEWQIPPGTPFAALPAQWSCPVCDAPKEKFLLLGAGDE
ncbi:rubredoxin [Rhodomicrobium lacus]|uniref:rubredoxin n=1 Tax=Rhodomicrobium TaxID=1068 RepID=UPI000F8E89B8|nr:rubredoxin [Rhodomicrobium lacus]WKW51746.1 rubredoxin [Rhodomicrobium lacus]